MASTYVSPIADILRFGAGGEDIDALDAIGLSDLVGDPAFLFSFRSLRILSSFYSTSEAVTKGLIRKLDAAAAAEARGHLGARNAELQGFRALVPTQSGRAFTADQVRVILAISRTV